MKNLSFVRGKIPCEIAVFSSGICEDGNAVVAAEFRGEGFFQESGKEIMDSDGRRVKLAGRLLIEGDIAPEVGFIGSGEVRIELDENHTRTLRIYEASRARGLNGAVSHTVVGLC